MAPPPVYPLTHGSFTLHCYTAGRFPRVHLHEYEKGSSFPVLRIQSKLSPSNQSFHDSKRLVQQSRRIEIFQMKLTYPLIFAIEGMTIF